MTLPLSIQRAAKLNVGDLLEAKIEGHRIFLEPKNTIDREIAIGLQDIKVGRTHGPFDTAEKAIAFLNASAKKYREKLRNRS